ncbi:uncharacterized protein LOC129577203 [Sitodiplosis mosellana]|uniref:uncharacterized protein LOC129577203 n=1 Tax=Sitodiplosis mosellana TaxID=263140 RepID=UPI0024439CD9|nr:uncharacterized protein LOC129577203 [Sitodiplosis mosellana]
MQITRVSSCCGFDLKMGGLFIGSFGVSFHLLNLILAFGWIDVSFNLFFMVVHLTWLYGIATKNPNYLICGLIFPVALSLFTIGAVFKDSIRLFSIVFESYFDCNCYEPEISNIIILTIFVYFAVSIFIAVDAYITIVKFSLYRRLTESKTESMSDLNINSIQMETNCLPKGENAIV